MKYPTSTAICEFESFLNAAGARVSQSPGYAAQKVIWPGLLQFLQPIVTGEKLFGTDAMKTAAPVFQREQTSVIDRQASDRAIYFGLMCFTIAISNRQRERYAQIHLDELAEAYRVQAFTPLDSLNGYGEFIQKALPGIEKVAKLFLIHQIQPMVTDRNKLDSAYQWFYTQFLCGVLLGQITDYFTLRDHLQERGT